MQLFEKVQELIESTTRSGKIPSCVLGIGVGNKVLFKRAWGKSILAGGNEDANIDTRYDVASLTKILSTTPTALKLIEDGLLCLSDTLSIYFDAPEDKANITIQMLMNHTSGLPPTINLTEKARQVEYALPTILAEPLAYKSGEHVQYSCMGYVLLGFIIEQITSMKLNDAAAHYVFKPLGMDHTGYLPMGDNIAATEHSKILNRCKRGETHDSNGYFLNGVAGNAGLFSNITDCLKYASMLANGGRIPDGSTFLSPTTITRAIYNDTPNFGENRGLGFKLKGGSNDFMGDLFPESSFGHTGFSGTSLVVDPISGLYIVILTNRIHPTRDNEHIFRFRKQLHNMIFAEFNSNSREV